MSGVSLFRGAVRPAVFRACRVCFWLAVAGACAVPHLAGGLPRPWRWPVSARVQAAEGELVQQEAQGSGGGIATGPDDADQRAADQDGHDRGDGWQLAVRPMILGTIR